MPPADALLETALPITYRPRRDLGSEGVAREFRLAAKLQHPHARPAHVPAERPTDAVSSSA